MKKIMYTLLCFNLLLSTVIFADEESKASAKNTKVDKAKKIKKEATAREIQKHALGVGIGQTFLFGDFEENGDNKITLDLLYSYTASYSFDLFINLHRSEHEFKDRKVRLQGLTVNVKARPYEFDSFSPFILAGFGFYSPQIVIGNEESEIKNTFGINGGVGADLRLNSQFVIGALAQFHWPFDIKQDEFQDVRGSYMKLLMTMMYLF